MLMLWSSPAPPSQCGLRSWDLPSSVLLMKHSQLIFKTEASLCSFISSVQFPVCSSSYSNILPISWMWNNISLLQCEVSWYCPALYPLVLWVSSLTHCIFISESLDSPANFYVLWVCVCELKSVFVAKYLKNMFSLAVHYLCLLTLFIASFVRSYFPLVT